MYYLKSISLFLIFGIITFKINAQNTSILPNKLDFAKRSYSQILAIPSPQKGNSCYDTDSNCLRIYNGTSWQCIDNISDVGFNDAEGYCSGQVSVSTSGGNTGQAPQFIESTSYNSNLFEVGSCPGIGPGGLGLGYNFGNGSISGTPNANNVGFISSYDINGTNLWVRSFYPTGPSPSANNASIVSVKVDGTGIYVIGNFTNSLNFLTSSTTSEIINSVGGYDIFVAKLNDLGYVQWIKQFGGGSDDFGVDLTFDDSSNIFFTGTEQGMTTGLCIPNTGNSDIFVGKLNKSSGNTDTQAGIIYEANNTEKVKNILYYDNKVLLVGSFKGILNYTDIIMCNIVSPASQLQGTNGTEIFIVSFNTSLVAIDTYKLKLGGDDANDNLSPFKAIMEKGFLGGKYINMIKIAGNATGTFTLNDRIVNSSSYLIPLLLNKDILPVTQKIIDIQGISITGFSDGYIIGSKTANSSVVNSSINFGEKTGDNFLISTSLFGNFKWVITSDVKPSITGFPVYQQSKTISKIGNNAYIMGAFSGLLQLCDSSLYTGIRYYGFLWRYTE
jgi:hypothetical protein